MSEMPEQWNKDEKWTCEDHPADDDRDRHGAIQQAYTEMMRVCFCVSLMDETMTIRRNVVI